MKTKEQYLAAMKQYQWKIQTYIWTLVFITLGILTAHLLSYHFPAIVPVTGPLWLFGMVALPAICWYFQRYEKNVSKSCGFVCPDCLHVMTGADFRSLKTTHLCPHCGKPFFD
jgi:hypothetical protein